MSEKYLIKVGDKLRVVTEERVNYLTLLEVMMLTMACSAELRKQLVQDCISKEEKLFYGRKVVEGLEKTLSKLNQMEASFKTSTEILMKTTTSTKVALPWVRNHIKRLAFNKSNVNN